MNHRVTQLWISLASAAILTAALGNATHRAWFGTVDAQPTTRAYTYRGWYHGQPVVLSYTGDRYFHGADIQEGTLRALGRHYWVEADYFYGVSTPDLFNRVYTFPTGARVVSLVAEFTLRNACNPGCSDSTSYSVTITMQGLRPGLPLPNGLILTHG